MKTQITKLALIAMVIMSAIACKKETPVTLDYIAPKLTFYISGNGNSKTFFSDSSYSYGQFVLKPNTQYNFILTGVDTGGIRTLAMSIPALNTLGTINSITANTISYNPSSYNNINVIGTASDPYKSFTINGSFTTSNTFSDTAFYILNSASDYANNLDSMKVNFFQTHQPNNGYGWTSL